MQFGVGAGLPGRPAIGNRGALTLRYRYWYEDFLKPRGLSFHPVQRHKFMAHGIRLLVDEKALADGYACGNRYAVQYSPGH